MDKKQAKKNTVAKSEISNKEKYKKYQHKSDTNSAFAKNIRAERKQAGLTQEQLAHLADLHTNYIGGIEQGERNPTAMSMDKIANALNVPMEFLVSKDYQPDSNNYALIAKTPDGYEFIDLPDEFIQNLIDLRKNSE